MGEVGGPRHYTDRTPTPVAWKCPSCRASNTTQFEEGCPACGAGTPAMNAVAQVAAGAAVDLKDLVIGGAATGMRDSLVAHLLGLKMYTHEVRVTIAAALAFSADNGIVIGPEGLSHRAMIEWARLIVGEGDGDV